VVLNGAIHRALGNDIDDALKHNDSDIRLAAFRSLEGVVPGLFAEIATCDSNYITGPHDPAETTALATMQHRETYTSLNHIEVEYWRKNLRYAIKVTEKGYILQLLASAMLLANRLLSDDPSLFQDFVVDFMIKSMFLEKLAYPGTVAAKEEFGLQLIEHVVALVKASDESLKKPSDLQRNAIHRVTLALLSDDVLHALYSLFHSSWESTRANSFQLLCKLLTMGRHFSVPLPKSWTTSSSILVLKLRAAHLASSPRQREADTGARILAMLSIIDVNHFQELVNLLTERLDVMQSSLRAIFSLLKPHDQDVVTKNGSSVGALSQTVKSLPLAHGFILALRLSIENKVRKQSASDFQKVSALCSQAIEMSLVVVTDVVDDETIDDQASPYDNKWRAALPTRVSSSSQQSCAPLNINTGALGANTSFASLKYLSSEDSDRRALTQRIVVSSILYLGKVSNKSLAQISSVLCAGWDLASYKGSRAYISLRNQIFPWWCPLFCG